MSVELKVGMEIPVVDALKGHSSRGPYFKATVKPEKGKDRIDIWATNPGEAINFVDAKLAQGNAEAVIFEQVELGNDDDLPFA